MKMLSKQYQNLQINEKAAYLYYKHIWNRVHKLQYNWGQAITGDPGSGKTKTATISACVLNRKRFNENFYCNTAREFIQAVDDSRTGDVIVWDEVGVSLSARQWYSLSNILTGETLQTYRANKLIVFFVVPDISFIDIQARKLLNAFIETERFSLRQTFNWTHSIDVNRKTGDIYYPRFRAVIEGRLMNIRQIIIPRRMINIVPKELLKALEEKELRFKNKLRKKNLRTIELIEKDAIGKTVSIFDMINQVMNDRNKFTNEKGRIDFYLIQTYFGVGKDKAIQIMKFVKKKGSLSTPV